MCSYYLVLITLAREHFKQENVALGCKSYAGGILVTGPRRTAAGNKGAQFRHRCDGLAEDETRGYLKVTAPCFWCVMQAPPPGFSPSLHPVTLSASPPPAPSPPPAIRLHSEAQHLQRSRGDLRCAQVGIWQRSPVRSGTSPQGGGRG